MIQTEKSIFIAFLITLILGITFYFQSGILVFSFPLNESILFFLSLTLYFQVNKEYKQHFIFLLIYSFYKFIQSNFILSFFVSESKIEKLINENISSFTLPIIAFIVYRIWFVFISKEKNYKLLLSLCVIGFLFMMINAYISDWIILLVQTSLLLIFFLLLSKEKKIKFKIFFYFFLFDNWLLFTKNFSILILNL